jgi:hypothetical protein
MLKIEYVLLYLGNSVQARLGWYVCRQNFTEMVGHRLIYLFCSFLMLSSLSMNFVAATFTMVGGCSSLPAHCASCYWRLWVTVILAYIIMFEIKVIMIFGAAGNAKHEQVGWYIWCWLLSVLRIRMDAASAVFCRHYFSSILGGQLIVSILDGCHVIILESHDGLGEDFLVFSVLHWCKEEGLFDGENLCVVD